MSRTLWLTCAMLLLPALAAACCVEQLETGSRSLAFSAGDAGPRASKGLGSGGRMELRLNEKVWVLQPFVGGIGGPRDQWHAYAGCLLDVRIGPYFVLTLSVAPGVYHSGAESAVGSPLEFRSQLELSFQFAKRPRSNFTFSHLFRAPLRSGSPSVESLAVARLLPPFNRAVSPPTQL